MFNLLVKAGGWDESGTDRMERERIFDYTAEHIEKRFETPDGLQVASLKRLPTLLMPEVSKSFGDDQLARIVTITDIAVHSDEAQISYIVDPKCPPIPSETIADELSTEWQFGRWEATRTHWAIKDVNLFRSLIPIYTRRQYDPKVFQLPQDSIVQNSLVSVMMPMNAAFNEVYSVIRQLVEDLKLECRRADDIWQSHAIMEDIVSLIAKSRIVIADCSGDNPNVFYEMGIAHTVGRDVIPISQSDRSLPFDIAHHRVLKYLDNAEGRLALGKALSGRITKLLGW